ncbi:glycosyl hydrolases family 31-domain-containing protein [Lipomyces starkeyi]
MYLADINYMNQYEDFTLGSSLSDWNDYVATLVRTISIMCQLWILDGKSSDVFLKWPSGTVFLGQVWPGVTVYADWFHPQSGTWWTNQIKTFHQMGSFDGLWIDMNEASNFVTPPGYEPAYMINNNGGWGVQGLNTRTLSTNLAHYSGISEHDVHNLFGHYDSIHTHNVLSALNPGQRTFILTRSSFAGTGQAHSQKWNGDNAATWDDLYLSVPQIMSNDWNTNGRFRHLRFQRRHHGRIAQPLGTA